YGVQVVRGSGHDVAGAVLLKIGVRKRLQVREEIVAQVEFNLARDADHQPSRQKLEDALDTGNGQQQQGINQDFVLRHSRFEVVDGTSDDLGKQHPYSVVEEYGHCAPKQRHPVFFKVRPEWLQVEHAVS